MLRPIARKAKREVRELSAQAAEHSEQGTGARCRLSEMSSELARLVGRFRA
ncbi:hypothetical protein ILR34_06635 [Pseudomonas aeruginosa]|nr:hypothetical protein [Pseudomonas aeruginosa]